VKKEGGTDIRAIKVFGSLARGEEGPDSDIDFLVKAAPGTTFITLSRFQRELEALLSCPVDVVTETGLSKHLKPLLDLKPVLL